MYRAPQIAPDQARRRIEAPAVPRPPVYEDDREYDHPDEADYEPDWHPGPPPKPKRRSRKAATPSMRKAGAAEPVEASPVSSKTPRAAKVAPALPLKATGT